MKGNFIVSKGQKMINLDFVLTVEFINVIDASVLGEFIIKDHKDGSSYIRFNMSNNELEFWKYEDETSGLLALEEIEKKVS